MSLPESWKLKTRKRERDGRLDIVGKDDAGAEYVARTTEAGEVTAKDISILAGGDRERNTARGVVQRQVDFQERRKREHGQQMMEEYTEAALPVVKAGFGIGMQLGYSSKYANQFKKIRW